MASTDAFMEEKINETTLTGFNLEIKMHGSLAHTIVFLWVISQLGRTKLFFKNWNTIAVAIVVVNNKKKKKKKEKKKDRKKERREKKEEK